MLLALRKDAPADATLWQRFACWAIKARLASQYCHGGVVIDGRMYHSTSARGLHMLDAHEWTPDRWVLIDLGDERDAEVLQIFTHGLAGSEYDWLSLLAFVGLPARDASRMYCFEWCWLAMIGEKPESRVTPELLILLSLVKPSRIREFVRFSRSLAD